MITLITPTVRRPECFKLLEGYIARQDYTGRLQWIVVTDAELDGYKLTMGQVLVVRDRVVDPVGLPSICGNYLAALEWVEGSKILCIEDDDFYRPDYVSRMSAELDLAPLVGSAPARYYNVLSRRWRILPNADYASLAQTGFRREVLECFETCCKVPNQPFVDMQIWTHWRTLGGPCRVFLNDGIHVGLKGLWGEPGIGLGHHPTMGTYDRGLAVFKDWLGDAWTNYYDE